MHRPIRRVGRTIALTNQKSFTKQRRSREGTAQPIRLRLAGSIGGRLVTPEGRTFFGLIQFLRILHQVRTTDQPIRSLHRRNSDGLIRTDFLRTNFVSSDSSPSEKHGSADQVASTVIEPLYHGHIIRRIYKIGWSESYRPIISIRQLLNRYIMVTVFGESTRLDVQNRIGQSYHLDRYSTVINDHSHWRHPQVRMVRT